MVLLSVCCIAYNQEKFIAQVIESFLFQKTTFSYEIIIHDDASTDNTAKIINEYALKYPDIIFPIFQKENQFSKNINPAYEFVIPKCKGKYIAVCEGDDYWTDPYKLQKQVDFLEVNQEYSMCFHQALVKFEDVKGKDHLFCESDISETTGVEEIITRWYIPSCSIVFNSIVFEIPNWFNYIYNGDYGLLLMLADKGKIKYIPELMSVYRKHSTGFSYTIKSKFIWEQKIKVLQYFDLYSNFKYHTLIENQVKAYFNDYEKIILAPKNNFEKITSIKWIKKKCTKILNKIFF
ncbi:MAG: glycosyltransferase [Bacteroidetes bacterium]|nr:glycosyltransferase [Bacteroidota bacterium]